MTNFADRLIDSTRKNGPLCIGIDPHWGRIPDLFGEDGAERVRNWGLAVLDAADGIGAIIKPQVGLFEPYGPAGMHVLAEVLAKARDKGFIVIADAKRGDIGSTATGYANAFLAPGAPYEADCLTVNPYMGIESLDPFFDVAQAHGKGLAVLVRTSNPGSKDFQQRDLEGQPLYLRVAEALSPMTEAMRGQSGWSSLMMVAGATGPEEAKKLRNAAPDALFLVPGYGAQGANASEAQAGFTTARDRSNSKEGGVVSASRSVTFPEKAQTATTLEAWHDAIRDAMQAAKTDLIQGGLSD